MSKFTTHDEFVRRKRYFEIFARATLWGVALICLLAVTGAFADDGARKAPNGWLIFGLIAVGVVFLTGMIKTKSDYDWIDHVMDLPTKHSTTPEVQPPLHDDDAAVNRFSEVMKAKLALCRAKGRTGWQDTSVTELEIQLRMAMRKGDVVDIANFCMMLHDLGVSEIIGGTRVSAHMSYAPRIPDHYLCNRPGCSNIAETFGGPCMSPECREAQR